MAIGRERGKGAEGRREGASWQRSVTGVCGPSTAIGHIPPGERRASRRLHSGHMVLSRGLPYQVCSVSVPRQSLDWHTLPDVAKIEMIDGHLLSPGRCSGLPDLLLVGPSRGVRQRFVLCQVVHSGPIQHPLCHAPGSSPTPQVRYKTS